jgi:hypothetical protein
VHRVRDDGACLLNETVAFPDGSTLELAGVPGWRSGPSADDRRRLRDLPWRDGLGGGRASDDLTTFTKTFEIHR